MNNHAKGLSERESFLMPWIASLLFVCFLALSNWLVYTIVPELEANACTGITEVTASAYDCSIQCTGKPLFHPLRGITADGTNLNGKSRLETMIVASNSYPLGTKLSLTFPDAPEYDGIYTVRDRGREDMACLDVFIGDDWNELPLAETCQFGQQEVEVEVIE